MAKGSTRRAALDGMNPQNETLVKAHYAERNCRWQRNEWGGHPKQFRRMAAEQLKSCDNITALAQELGVNRRLLYKWRDQLDPSESSEESPPQTSRESTLRKEVSLLKRLLADKALEL